MTKAEIKQIILEEIYSALKELKSPTNSFSTTEMENILMMSQSGIIIDQMTQKQRAEKFQKMQQEVMDLDNDFKVELQKLKSKLSSESYSYLESYITEWSVKNDIDIVLGTAEVVFSKPELDITNQILDVLKSKGLYSEYVEESETNI